jgi:LacI family transcriptional regulator
MTAIGVMRQSYEEKISIPRDLSVVGFDDIRLAQFVLPPLTSVRMSQSELARLAFHALLSDVQRQTPAPNGTEYVMQTSLVLRESTALAPGLPARASRNNTP